MMLRHRAGLQHLRVKKVILGLVVLDDGVDELGMGKVAQPIRVAVTGKTISPPIYETLEILGRDKTLSRIDRCLAMRSQTPSRPKGQRQ